MLCVVVLDEQSEHAVDRDRFAALAENCLVDRDVHDGELNLIFVDIPTMTGLNLEHMREPGPTDVLSFPIDAGEGAETVETGPVLLGDIVICPDVAARQANERAVSFDDEVALLVVHGVLHILGYDHADPVDASEMQGAERDL
ncbi:MAG: rRNA maturation RNase YbeY, partial [Acidimicrobiales bacterium]